MAHSAVENGGHEDGDSLTDSVEEDLVRQRSHSFPAGRPWKRLPIPTVESRGLDVYKQRLDMLAQEKHHPMLSTHLQEVLGVRPTTSWKRGFSPHPEDWTLDTPTDIRHFRKNHLRVMGESQDPNDGWRSFLALSTRPFVHVATEAGVNTKIPLAHLHRLARLLARVNPKTRTVFVRQVEVLRFIQTSGGTVHLHEWNALLDNSGKGWRKTHLDDFTLALTVFKDMIAGQQPDSHLASSPSSSPTSPHAHPFGTPKSTIVPDIYTYNTLITIASKTGNSHALRQATELLLSAGLTPDRITHLAMLRFFVATKQISGVRSTLAKMRHQRLELGLDGVNAALWAFAHVGRLDVVLDVYRVLRHHLLHSHSTTSDGEEVERIGRHLCDEENIELTPGMVPNQITFHLVTQIFAYSGDLNGALNVLQDMLTTVNTEVGAPLKRDVKNGMLLPHQYHPSLIVFRAIFLGYARHGVPPDHPPSSSSWNLDNLKSLFYTFLEQPAFGDLPQSTVYYIMKAFSRVSGDDEELLQEVWLALEQKYNGPWGSPSNRLQKMRKRLFPALGHHRERLSS